MVPGSLEDQPVRTWIRTLPKIELHLHLEGSVGPDLLETLARKNRVDLPLGPSGSAENFYRFRDFPGFLDCFRRVCQVLRSPEDLVLVAENLFAELIRQKVIYAEIFLSPVIYPTLGWSVREAMPAIHAAALAAEKRSGLVCRFLFDSVRQWGRKAMEDTAALAEECRCWGVAGIGLGGQEDSVPARDFEDIFDWASGRQLLAAVHAGETGGPENVREALQYLHPRRIGHGLGAAADPALLEELKQKGILVDVCLTSNLRTGVWTDLPSHPVHRFYQAGVPFSLNTDDPGIFGTSLGREIALAADLLSLDLPAVQKIMRRSAEAAFLPPDQKSALLSMTGVGPG